jgi:uncharacterized protein (TIGR03435 family)
MTLAAFLIAWIARSALLIFAGALLLRLFRVTNPSLRLTAWTALLIGSLSIPLLTTTLPELPIHLLPQNATATVVSPALDFTNPGEDAALNVNIASAPPQPAPAQPIDWMQLALVAYATIAAALLARLFIGLWLSLGILRRSSPANLPANRAGVRVSSEVESPVTAGILHPTVLLPNDWRAWDATRLNAVLAHESSHARRRDPTVQFLSSLHCALLWINPATWLLHRVIVRTGEEISDEDAVTVTPDRTTYVEILLDFMQRGARPNPVEVAMARYDQPNTRIRRILSATAGAHYATRAGVASTLALIVPLSCLAAIVYPRHSAAPPSAVRVAPPPGLPSAAPLPELAQVTAPSLPSPPPVTEKLPQFEVATVKPAPEGGRMGVKVHPGARVEISRFELGGLVIAAFGVQPWQLLGGDPWTREVRYTIEAKPPAEVASKIQDLRYGLFTIEDKSLRQMLQALLIERFHLRFHREMRDRDVLLLKRSGDPLRLRPAEPLRPDDTDNYNSFSSIGRVEGRYSIFATSMPQLAHFASGFILRSPVLDRTDLTGSFDYRQKSDLDPTNNLEDSVSSFYDFLKEAGLKLERSRGAVEYFVIDHAEKPSAD